MTDELKKLKYRLESWVATGLLYPVQAKRILEWESHGGDPRVTYYPATHTTFTELFADIRNFVARHPGANVIAADNPTARHLGWVAFCVEGEWEHSEQFSISLDDVKALSMVMDPADPLREMLKTADGRRRLAEQLAQPTQPGVP